jgi:hypothetical protein
VVTVAINFRTGTNQQVDPMADSAALSLFNISSSYSLGPSYSNLSGGTSPDSCEVFVELSGAVTPSNYQGQVTLRRTIVSGANFNGSAPSQSPYLYNYSGDDSSRPPFLDTYPQSGSSTGTVYDIDGPGVTLTAGGPSTDVIRQRVNFIEYAVVGDSSRATVASPNFQWYSRSSCTYPRPLFASDVTGDNQAGTGTTPITWNLQ